MQRSLTAWAIADESDSLCTKYKKRLSVWVGSHDTDRWESKLNAFLSLPRLIKTLSCVHVLSLSSASHQTVSVISSNPDWQSLRSWVQILLVFSWTVCVCWQLMHITQKTFFSLGCCWCSWHFSLCKHRSLYPRLTTTEMTESSTTTHSEKDQWVCLHHLAVWSPMRFVH